MRKVCLFIGRQWSKITYFPNASLNSGRKARQGMIGLTKLYTAAASLLVTCLSFGQGLSSLGASIRVDPLDPRNYSRTPPLAELVALGKILDENCSQVPQVIARDETLRWACGLSGAIAAFTKAREQVSPFLLSSPEQLVFGTLHLRAPLTPQPNLVPQVRKYLLARRALDVRCNAANLIIDRWWRLTSRDYYRYVLPQSAASLAGDSGPLSRLAFGIAMRCTDPECNQAKAEVAALVRWIVEPVLQKGLTDAMTRGSTTVGANNPYAGWTRRSTLARLRTAFEQAAQDPSIIEGFARDVSARPVPDRYSRLDVALTGWVNEMFRIPFFGNNDREQTAGLVVLSSDARNFIEQAHPPADPQNKEFLAIRNGLAEAVFLMTKEEARNVASVRSYGSLAKPRRVQRAK